MAKKITTDNIASHAYKSSNSATASATDTSLGTFDGTTEFDLTYDPPHVEINGHQIIWKNGFTSFECQYCGTSHDIPDIFTESTAHSVVMYQLYLFGKFMQEDCEATRISDLEAAMKDIHDLDDDTYTPVDPHKTHRWRTQTRNTL